nr:hypothetical protein Itr_chr15CG16800 [Ipomoea trifida]
MLLLKNEITVRRRDQEFGDSSDEEPVDSEAALLSTGDIKQSSFSRNSIASSPLFAEDDGPAATASLDRPSLPIPSINNLIKQQLTEIEADTSVNFKEKSRHLFGDVSVIRGGHPIGIGNLVQKGKEGEATSDIGQSSIRQFRHQVSIKLKYHVTDKTFHFGDSFKQLRGLKGVDQVSVRAKAVNIQPPLVDKILGSERLQQESRSDGRKVSPVMKMRNEERPDEEPCAVAEWEWRHGWFGEVAYVIVCAV